jgi:hypothetical protein
MSRFSDSPYFLLKDFVGEITATETAVLSVEQYNQWPDVVFTDIIFVGGAQYPETSNQFENTIDKYVDFDINTDYAQKFESDAVVWNAILDLNAVSYYSDDTLPSVGILRGGDSWGSIVVDGGKFIDIYAKLDNIGFVPVRLKPVAEIPREKKYFRFDFVEINTLLYDGTVVVYNSDLPADEPYFDSSYVSIQTMDYMYDITPPSWRDLTIDDILNNGTEMYFRKDSAFHDWLNIVSNGYYLENYNVEVDSRNYVNTDKSFIYFGDIYPTAKDSIGDPNRYHIVFNGMKDWVQSALPSNNRTDNLVEFLDTHFDQVYSEGYQLLKDVWSLRDGRECNNKFLGYIPTFYGIEKDDDIPSWFSDRYREYASELVWLMKRKGTYAAMYIIYELMCGNSPNIFNVLERWHSDPHVDPTEYEDHIYTELYGKENPDGSLGAGDFWYAKFNTVAYPQGYLASDNKILSPYYRVDLDLSVQPVTTFEILPEDIAKALYKNWELQRPVNRQAEYNLIYAPYCDISGKSYTLYEDGYAPQSVTYSPSNLVFDENNYIHIQRVLTPNWTVEHGLNTTEVIVTVYDSNLEEVAPTTTKIVSDNVVSLTFGVSVIGIVVVSRAINTHSPFDAIAWKIHHGLARNESVHQVIDSSNMVYQPTESYIEDSNTLVISNAESGSVTHIKAGLSIGDTYDSDDDGIEDSVLTSDVWMFNDVWVSGDTTNKVTTYVYEGVEYIAWVINHPLPVNIFQVNCFNAANEYVIPRNILVGENSDIDLTPQVVVLWAENVIENDPSDYFGFAAITKIGNLGSFYGGVPVNLDGDPLPVEWRLTIENETDIFTFLTEGSSEALALIGDGTKTIHYHDPLNPSNPLPYVYGTTDIQETSGGWYYYTFTVSNEAKKQLNEEGYMIRSIELVNTMVTRIDMQRIMYSKISGIYKPYGVNFVGHYRIFGGDLGAVLLDHKYNVLLDTFGEPLYA